MRSDAGGGAWTAVSSPAVTRNVARMERSEMREQDLRKRSRISLRRIWATLVEDNPLGIFLGSDGNHEATPNIYDRSHL